MLRITSDTDQLKVSKKASNSMNKNNNKEKRRKRKNKRRKKRRKKKREEKVSLRRTRLDTNHQKTIKAIK